MSSKKTKNKHFLQWSKAESCFRKDNIVSTDWHERLERVPMFIPSYAQCRPDMVYIMSMEYARLWQKEKEEWFSQIFKAEPKQEDLNNRRKKLRKEFLEAKRQAEIKIKERKERLAKEAEAKAKADAEAAEKAKRMKLKLEKRTIKKKDKKKKAPEPLPEPEKPGPCPKGWKQVELTVQYECADKKDDEKSEQPDRTKENATNQQSTKIEHQQNSEARKEPPETVCLEVCGGKQTGEAIPKAQEESDENGTKCAQ